MTPARSGPDRPILVFDSGFGGLSVYAAIRAALPDRRCVYVADDAAFPYGGWDELALKQHIVELMGELIAQIGPSIVVIACNTASTLVLGELRARYQVPFVGTVPAIKPAAKRSKTGIVSVLATPGTIARDYTRDLIDEFAQTCHVRLVGAPDLARLAEAALVGEPVAPEAIREQIAPCFQAIGSQQTDIVVLACTHYPFLITHMQRLAPWPVEWLNPAAAIASRVASVIDGSARPNERHMRHLALFTSRRPVSAGHLAVLEAHELTLLDDQVVVSSARQ